MMDVEKSDILLSKWLSGEMSKEELENFKQLEDYKLFNRIAKESKGFERPVLNKEETYLNILSAIENIKSSKKTKTNFGFNKKLLAIAASIALIFSVFYFNFKRTNIATGYGEHLTIKLPDNSEVILNSKSAISYNKKKWNTNRVLKLEGEAFFKVKKGSTFVVKSKEGTVTVLGTQFNVLENENFLEVECYEGKVKVEANDEVVILTKGKKFTKFKKKGTVKNTIKKEQPSWTEKESIFESVPLKVVLKSLENQYNIKFKDKLIDVNKLFTGSFEHHNLSLALETVLIPMGIEYTINEKNKTIELQ
ncbi:FecR family protein [Tenacibaculum soleae]|uniref:FecR family protein n=1 Tax=Tenacibaculum soleae TaxID=447689 RepID=UPI0026E2A8C1|nr:FecR family protein [Tenacibaculum soleae]MDO6744762.1 FecR family protein [Tenacibaculum soleae]